MHAKKNSLVNSRKFMHTEKKLKSVLYLSFLTLHFLDSESNNKRGSEDP